jgi:putative nucleotidyltransferase with HDIG domain
VDIQSFNVIQCRNKQPAHATGPDGSNERLGAVAETFPRLSDALVRTMTARDGSTQQHSQRVQRCAVALAREAGITDCLMLEAIDGAALLHDIGKLGIPDLVLQKPGPLTRDEYDRVKQHVVIGADILLAAAFPGPLALIVRHHHENWDGTGYPDGLQEQAIPIGARVLAIVDCYDALTSDRPYRRALSHGSAVAMIHERRGTMYDPDIADAFLRIVQRMRSGSGREGTVRAQTRVPTPGLVARAV